MAEYRLANGEILTDEDLEREARGYESGEWLGQLTDLRIGRPSLAKGQQSRSLSFKCPELGVELIENAAAVSGKGKSAFIREAALEKAVRVLGQAG